jgi:lipopolysaccharide/colanic/teichoic acid biosynthesis glycosyltransferase
VNFRLVPNSLEAIIGKTRIDQLDTIPLVEIDYNIHKAANRFTKRLFDIVCSVCLLASAYPVVRLRMMLRKGIGPGRIGQSVLLIPQVLAGNLSMVGRPLSDVDTPVPVNGQANRRLRGEAAYLGPRGLTGLVQINERADRTQDETDRYKIYYAKNQSLVLDCEIILKSLLLSVRGRGRRTRG